MSRLNPSGISLEIREKLAATGFTSFTIAEIPTGRDPRRLSKDDNYPMLLVHIPSTVTGPHGIGGTAKAWHGICFYWANIYQDGDDIATMKQLAAEEIFDFICNNYCGDTYQFFVSDDSGNNTGWPEIDYEPPEEMAYEDANICLLKVSAALRQLEVFSIK